MTISISNQDRIRTVTLNRPETYNAFSEQLTTDLAAALRDAERDASVAVLILTGAGKAFSSGQDLAELKARYQPGYVPELSQDLYRRYNPIIQRLAAMPKPVIAAVNGVAAGAGASLALACDFRIAAEGASFAEVFINVGLIPDSGSSYFLPRIVGYAKALELCLTGERITSAEALRLGIVRSVVPAEQLLTEAHALASRIAAMPSRAVALTKRLMQQSLTNTLEQQLQAEAWDQETAGRTADHMEGVVAFLEKRKPVFTGR